MRFFHTVSAPRQAELMLVAVTLLAASGWVFSHEALKVMAPFVFIGVRFLASGLLLALWQPGSLRQLIPEQLRAALWAGSCFAVAMLLWIWALKQSPHLGVGAFLNSTAVIWVPVLGWLLWRQQISALGWLCAALAGMGVLALSGGTIQWGGSSWYLLAALVIGLYLHLNGRAAALMPTLPLTVMVLLMVGMAGLAMAVVMDEPWHWPDPWTLGMLTASALLATCLRFWLQTHAQARLPAAHAALLLTLEPVWTLGLGAIVLGERLGAVQWLGCGLIFTALLLSRLWPVIKAKQPLTAD